jgi:hypothetical protein
MDFLINVIGWTLIWIAVDFGRPKECRFSLFQWEGFFQFILILFGGILLM